MLNTGLRDEQSEKINTVLAQLLTLDFVPENKTDLVKNDVEKQLVKIDLSIQKIIAFDLTQLLSFLNEKNFDWTNYELFADFLICLSNIVEEHRNSLKEKAIGIYHHIQQQNKTFSFDIFNKINQVKS